MRILIALFILSLLAACGGEGGTDQADTTSPDAIWDSSTQPDSLTPDTSSGNRPPVLYKIGDKVVAVGEPLIFTLKAEDPDGDVLRFRVYGDLPRTAEFLQDKGEFTWTPEAGDAGKSAFLTFVVSDSQAFDRETIEIAVTHQASEHPPAFEPMGDQTVEAGKSYTWQLEATDPDSDELSYSIDGGAPPGASLQPKSGLFDWTVPQGMEGQVFTVRFVVDDGSLSDDMTVTFVVAGGQTNHAPAFGQLQDVEVVAGQPVEILVTATDPEGDALSFGTQGELPPGASFDPAARRFTWTPDASTAGKVFDVTFTVTDQQLTAYAQVSITVKADATGSCNADPMEPNDDPEEAPLVSAGTTPGLTLCPLDGWPDEDWFKLSLQTGDVLRVALQADNDTVDVDIEIYAAGSDDLLSYGYYPGATDQAMLPIPADGVYLIRLYQYYGDPSSESVGYTLTIEVDDDFVCDNDGMEPNEDANAATPLEHEQWVDGMICPGDHDWYALDHCDETLSISLAFDHVAGDLDLHLFSPDGVTLLKSSNTTADLETVVLGESDAPGRYFAVVVGYPPEGAINEYILQPEVDLEGPNGCCGDVTPDANEPDDTPLLATPVWADTSYESLTRGCDEDWFITWLNFSDILVVEATGAATPVEIVVLHEDGETVLGSGMDELEFWPETEGDYYIVVRGGTTGASYDFDIVFLTGA
jgi:hypothetical protein